MDFCSGMLAETHLMYDRFCLLPSVLLFELVVSRPQKRMHFTFEVISGNAHEVKNDMPRLKYTSIPADSCTLFLMTCYVTVFQILHSLLPS